MRSYIFNFSQLQAYKLGLTLDDLLLLDYLNNFFESGSATSILHEDSYYYWITYSKIKDDLPIKRVDNRQLANMVNDLIDKGLIYKYKEKRNSTKMYLSLNLKPLSQPEDQYETYIGEDTALAQYSNNPNSVCPTINVVYKWFLYKNSVIKASKILGTVGIDFFCKGLKLKFTKLLSDKVNGYMNHLWAEVGDGFVKIFTGDMPIELMIDNKHKIERAICDTYIALLPKLPEPEQLTLLVDKINKN